MESSLQVFDEKSRNRPLTKFPNIFVLGTAGMQTFLARYHNYYNRNNRNNRYKDARLPARWNTILNDEQLRIENGEFAPYKLSFVSSGSDEVRLQMELKKGTLIWNNSEEIVINSWKVSLSTTIAVTKTTAITTDRYPYYKLSYDKLKENYLAIAQLSFSLQELTINATIDFNEATLSETQKQVFTQRMHTFVKDYINCHQDFVLLYVGLGSKLNDIGTYAKHLFFPHIVKHHVYKNENTEELRIHYTNFIGTNSDWNGNLTKPFVPYQHHTTAGVLLLGQMSVFTFLMNLFTKQQKYQVVKNGTQISKIEYQDNRQLISLKMLHHDEKICFRVERQYYFSSVFNLPILGGKPHETFQRTYFMRGKRDFEIAIVIAADGKSLTIDLVKDDTVNPQNDTLSYQDEGKPEEIIPKDSIDYECIKAGRLTERGRKSIIEMCIRTRFHDCGKLMNIYENLYKTAHPFYVLMKKRVIEADQRIHFPMGKHQFFHFPETEIVHFKNVRADEAWNFLLDINIKSKPSLQ